MNSKKHFTIWYVRRGYIFDPETGFECPFWVKPLLIFFSPSVYTHIVFGEWVYKNLMEGMKGVKMEKVFSYVLGEETEYYPPVGYDDYDEHENDMYYIGDSEEYEE